MIKTQTINHLICTQITQAFQMYLFLKMSSKSHITHADLINKFKDGIFKLEEIKEDITLTEKRKNKVKSIISTSFIKLNIRKVIDMDQYINDTLNYYIFNMKKLKRYILTRNKIL